MTDDFDSDFDSDSDKDAYDFDYEVLHKSFLASRGGDYLVSSHSTQTLPLSL